MLRRAARAVPPVRLVVIERACGCTVGGIGTADDPVRPALCGAHAAAPILLEAVLSIARGHPPEPPDKIAREAIDRILRQTNGKSAR